jgi:hypothetical protein
MAEIDDLKKRIEELEKEKTSRRTSEEANAVAEATRRAAMSAEDLSKATETGAQNYKKIDENIKTIANNKKIIIDYEQIESELGEEKLNRLKEEFRINQQTLLQLLQQQNGRIGENEELDKKIEHLEKITRLQGKQIQDANKEKEIKEKTLSVTRQLGEELKKQVENTEKHIIELSKLTGGYEGMFGMVSEASALIAANTLATGITIEQGRKAFSALATDFLNLRSYGADAAANMSVVAAQMEKVGISGQIAGKTFDSLVNAMGKTPVQAGKIQESFVQMAAKNRLALNSVTQAFGENSSRFVGYGEQMTKVLDGLAEQSLQTGIAIGKLVGIAQGFDTFEDASRKVGNLNALLGGDYFNSIELLTASDEERIKILKEGIAASGIQFESMNRLEKMAIANAAGISDLNEASKLFGQTSLQNTKQQAEAAEVQKTLAEQAQSASLAMDKLRSMFNGLIIAIQPITTALMFMVDILSKVVQGINSVAETFTGSSKAAALITSSLVLVIYRFSVLGRVIGFVAKGIMGSLVSAFSSLTASAPAAGASVGGAIETVGKAAKSVTKEILYLGGAIFLIGAGIGIAALGFSKLVLAFKELGSEQASSAMWSIIAIMTGFTIMVVSLAAVAYFATPAIAGLAGAFLALGGAVALIGAGIGIAAAGIGYMVDNMADLVDSFSKLNADEVGKFTSLFSDENIKQVEKFAEAISKLNDPFNTLNNNLKSIVTNLTTMVPDMSLQVSATPVSLATAAAGLESVTNTTNSVINNTRNTSAQTLIPAQQTTAFVPLVVQIDKKTIIEILKEDVKNIAKGEALDTLDAVGVTQSAFYAINRVSNP